MRDRDSTCKFLYRINVFLFELINKVLRADDIRARLGGIKGLLAVRKDDDAVLPARAMRELDDSAEVLLRVAGVDVEAEDEVEGLVEGGPLALAYVGEGEGERVGDVFEEVFGAVGGGGEGTTVAFETLPAGLGGGGG